MILDSQMYYNNTLQIRAFFKWQPLRLYNRYTNNSESKCFIKISMAYSFVLMCLITTSNFMTKLLKWWYLVGICLVRGWICRSTTSATTPWLSLCNVTAFDPIPPRTFGVYLWSSTTDLISFTGNVFGLFSVYKNFRLRRACPQKWIVSICNYIGLILGTYPLLDITRPQSWNPCNIISPFLGQTS